MNTGTLKVTPELRLEGRPSRIGLRWALLLHGLMALAWGLSQPPFLVSVAVVLVWLLSVWSLWKNRNRVAVQGLRYRVDAWQWQQGGRWLPAQRLPGKIVTPWLMLLRFRVQGRKRHCLLWPDSADADSLRRLRVLLLSQPES